MNDGRLESTFLRLQEQGQAAFVAYICAGDPDPDTTVAIALALEEAGVDVLELGVPFSDPLADGIVNQLAAERALRAGTSVPVVLDMVRRIREKSEMPLVLFTYLNPVYTYGFVKFHEDAAAAGVDGILLLDLPPDEAEVNPELMAAHGLRHIRLIAPTTPASRIQFIADRAEGFIYYVSREGVTGTQSDMAEGMEEQVSAIRALTSVPVAVGFGISTPAQASQVAACSDGVVVGSAIVKIIATLGKSPETPARVADFIRPLAAAAHKKND
jgi:tryptophan synthase alpha chain